MLWLILAAALVLLLYAFIENVGGYNYGWFETYRALLAVELALALLILALALVG